MRDVAARSSDLWQQVTVRVKLHMAAVTQPVLAGQALTTYKP